MRVAACVIRLGGFAIGESAARLNSSLSLPKSSHRIRVDPGAFQHWMTRRATEGGVGQREWLASVPLSWWLHVEQPTRIPIWRVGVGVFQSRAGAARLD
jgi:hypothetical protein